MPQLENARKYILLAFFAGWVSFAFILFLQPLGPARFVASAFHISHAAGFTVTTLSLLGFWASVTLLFVGAVGIILLVNKHFGLAKTSNTLERDAYADEGEENWIFI